MKDQKLRKYPDYYGKQICPILAYQFQILDGFSSLLWASLGKWLGEKNKQQNYEEFIYQSVFTHKGIFSEISLFHLQLLIHSYAPGCCQQLLK